VMIWMYSARPEPWSPPPKFSPPHLAELASGSLMRIDRSAHSPELIAAARAAGNASASVAATPNTSRFIVASPAPSHATLRQPMAAIPRLPGPACPPIASRLRRSGRAASGDLDEPPPAAWTPRLPSAMIRAATARSHGHAADRFPVRARLQGRALLVAGDAAP